MKEQDIVVTVGIPTYNRERLVGRAIQSVLSQDHPKVEIVISDNCSTDQTSAICESLASAYSRIKYVRQSVNIGATRNFEAVLKMASGAYFMWLSDDDYIEPNYVKELLRTIQRDPTVALASGNVDYYRNEMYVFRGRIFRICASTWWLRICAYYWKVSDNGVFYGLARTSTLREIRFENVMGGDWLLVARLAATGSLVMQSNTTIHRELGGMSRSPADIAKTLGLSRVAGKFPYVATAFAACSDLISGGSTFARFNVANRFAVAVLALTVLMIRAFTSGTAERLVFLRNRYLRTKGGL